MERIYYTFIAKTSKILTKPMPCLKKLAKAKKYINSLGLTLNDLLESDDLCDLLCKVGDKYVRLPFEEKEGTVIGICWSDAPTALLLETIEANWYEATNYGEELSIKSGLNLKIKLPEENILHVINKINNTRRAMSMAELPSACYWTDIEKSDISAQLFYWDKTEEGFTKFVNKLSNLQAIYVASF